MNFASCLLILVLLAAPLAAQDLDLIADPGQWVGNVDRPGAKVTILRTDDAPLAADVVADGNAEDYPKLRLMFAETQDWSGYMRLRVKLRVTCDEPGVTTKRVAIVFYDRETLREDLADKPMRQQVVEHYVPVNRWMTYQDWLVNGSGLPRIHRNAISYLDMYIYEDSANPHDFRWEFAELKLEGVAADVTAFDTELYAGETLKGEAGRPVGAVSSGDGLSLEIDNNGAIGSITTGGNAIGGQTSQACGMLLRDAATPDPPVMLGGTVSIDGESIRQSGSIEALGLEADVTYQGLPDRIEISGKVRDLRGEDRAVTVYLALPLSDEQWLWWENAARTQSEVPPTGEFSYVERGVGYGQGGTHSKYPVGAATVPGKAGLAVGVRMDEPVVHRIALNPKLRLLYIAFDFGLIPEQTIHGRSLAEAPFRILLYRVDPEWGFRSALQRYYDFFPEFFTRRVDREGGWYVWGDMRDTEGALDAGFGFHWGPSSSAVKWDNDNDVLSLLYIEPELFQQTMGDFDRAPTAEEAIERLRKITDGDEEELAKFEKLGYASSYVPGNWIKEHSLREAVRAVAKAAYVSGNHDSTEGVRPGIGQYSWMTESKWGIIFPCNLDPEIPGGKGWFCRELFIEPGLRSLDDLGAHYDGIALDSFGGYGQFGRANYRREHFKYADFPLSFGASDHRPVQVAAFATIEWLRDLAEAMHERDLVLMTNCSWNLTPGWLTFAAPYLDIFGAEATRFVDPDFIRAIAYQKSCTDLPYDPRPEWEVPWHMLHGIFPGHGNDVEMMTRYAEQMRTLAAAGWEPVTHARTAAPQLQVERFGEGEAVYLVVHNASDETVSSELSIDLKSLEMEDCTASDLVSGAALTITDGKLPITLTGKETLAVELRR